MAEDKANPFVLELHDMRTEALAKVATLADLDALDAWRIHYLGRRGVLTHIMRGIGQLPTEQRRQVGQVSNAVKAALEKAFEAQVDTVKQAQLTATLLQQKVDVTLPGSPVKSGTCPSQHPNSA